MHRTGDGPDQLGGHTFDNRILRHLDPVGKQLRRGHNVAQVVADFAHRRPQLRKPFLLLERLCQVGLQCFERFFSLAQFRHTGGRMNDTACILGRGGIALHMARHPLDRL